MFALLCEFLNPCTARFAKPVSLLYFSDDRQIAAIKLQHNKECKGLIVQIRYLKAKFTRESCLRSDLGYQKQYLLVLLTKFEKR